MNLDKWIILYQCCVNMIQIDCLRNSPFSKTTAGNDNIESCQKYLPPQTIVVNLYFTDVQYPRKLSLKEIDMKILRILHRVNTIKPRIKY